MRVILPFVRVCVCVSVCVCVRVCVCVCVCVCLFVSFLPFDDLACLPSQALSSTTLPALATYRSTSSARARKPSLPGLCCILNELLRLRLLTLSRS
jgi:hypothetical protein